jgi:hypothetical protein
MENAYPAFDPTADAPINSLIGHSITYRVATGPREGQKVFTLQTLPPDPDRSRANVAESSGFSLHAGVWVRGGERSTRSESCEPGSACGRTAVPSALKIALTGR